MSESVDLGTALLQMEEDDTIPDGFHMMFFSEEFKLTEDCPMNKLLKMVTEHYDCGDSLKRQIYQMPENRNIITYEFAWVGEFSKLQKVMEDINDTINDGLSRMVAANDMQTSPKRRIQFLLIQEEE
jgi:hypothetical protein